MAHPPLFRIDGDKQLEIVGCAKLGPVESFTRDELDSMLMIGEGDYYTLGTTAWFHVGEGKYLTRTLRKVNSCNPAILE